MSEEGLTLKTAVEAYLKSLAEGGTKSTTVNVYRLCRARHNLYYAEFRIMPSGTGI